MAEKKQPNRINTGSTGEHKLKKKREEEFDITGNVKRKGEDPSPDDRARGETSEFDRASPVDAGR
jgi:hypothetical protein